MSASSCLITPVDQSSSPMLARMALVRRRRRKKEDQHRNTYTQTDRPTAKARKSSYLGGSRIYFFSRDTTHKGDILPKDTLSTRFPMSMDMHNLLCTTIGTPPTHSLILTALQEGKEKKETTDNKGTGFKKNHTTPPNLQHKHARQNMRYTDIRYLWHFPLDKQDNTYT